MRSVQMKVNDHTATDVPPVRTALMAEPEYLFRAPRRLTPWEENVVERYRQAKDRPAFVTATIRGSHISPAALAELLGWGPNDSALRKTADQVFLAVQEVTRDARRPF